MTTQWSFIEHVTDSLGRRRGGDPKHPTLWPSEATALITTDSGKEKVVGRCRRATFFRYLIDNYNFYERYEFWSPLVEEIKLRALPMDRYLLWICKQGDLYEEYVVQEAKNSGVFFSSQENVYVRSHNISGKKDIVVLNPLTNKLTTVECKSVYGYGANKVVGTRHERAKGKMGVPRESHLMQLGIYHWWSSSEDPAYEESRLIYGSRDTGRYAEYLVKTLNEDHVHIYYKPLSPYEADWIQTPITVNSILDQYKYVQVHVDSGIVPPRDFNLWYSEEELAELYEEGELTKTETTQYEKVIARRAENVDLEQAGLKKKKELKQIEKGSFQCGYCSYKNICYKENGTPRDIG